MQTQLLEGILKLIADNTVVTVGGIAIAVPTVVLLTAILKRIFKGVDANVIRLFVQVLIWVGYKLALEAGYGNQFSAILPAVTSVATALLGGMFSEIGANAMYAKMQSAQVAILGYKRSD